MNDDTSDDNLTPGWDAITAALERLYPGQEPKHYGTFIKWMLGGKDPLDGQSAYKRLEPVPHWHIVSYGLSELYRKESDDAERSGHGFELTFRVACLPQDEELPMWALNFMQNLARYVFQSGNVFGDGHWMTANGPIAVGTGTQLCSMGFVFDPELPAIETPNGRVAFIQIVGLTLEEEGAAKRWQTRKLLDVLLPRMPLWITDLARGSLLEAPDIARQIEVGQKRDGSSSGFLYTDVLAWKRPKKLFGKAPLEITLGARQIDEIVTLLPMRLPFGRDLCIVGTEGALEFSPGERNQLREDEHVLIPFIHQ